MFISAPWDVKEPTHYSRRVGDEVPGVDCPLCVYGWVGIAGPHQLNSWQNFNLLKQINNKQTNKQTSVSCALLIHPCLPFLDGLFLFFMKATNGRDEAIFRSFAATERLRREKEFGNGSSSLSRARNEEAWGESNNIAHALQLCETRWRGEI